jgi:hypothetical protein
MSQNLAGIDSGTDNFAAAEALERALFSLFFWIFFLHSVNIFGHVGCGNENSNIMLCGCNRPWGPGFVPAPFPQLPSFTGLLGWTVRWEFFRISWDSWELVNLSFWGLSELSWELLFFFWANNAAVALGLLQKQALKG